MVKEILFRKTDDFGMIGALQVSPVCRIFMICPLTASVKRQTRRVAVWVGTDIWAKIMNQMCSVLCQFVETMEKSRGTHLQALSESISAGHIAKQ